MPPTRVRREQRSEPDPDAREVMRRQQELKAERWVRSGVRPGPRTMTDEEFYAGMVWSEQVDVDRLNRMRAERGMSRLQTEPTETLIRRLKAEEAEGARNR